MDRGRGYNRVARKLVHIAGGVPAFVLPFIPYWLALAGSLAGVLLAFNLRPRHAWWLRSITKPVDRNRGVITGLRGYFIAVCILILMWPIFMALGLPHSVYYVMFGWLALAWGDGLAGLIGPGPSVARTVPWNRHKTWWGALGCTLGCALAYITCFSFASADLAPELWRILAAALASGLAVAAIETFELRFDDNYTVGLMAPFVALGVNALLR